MEDGVAVDATTSKPGKKGNTIENLTNNFYYSNILIFINEVLLFLSFEHFYYYLQNVIFKMFLSLSLK